LLPQLPGHELLASPQSQALSCTLASPEWPPVNPALEQLQIAQINAEKEQLSSKKAEVLRLKTVLREAARHRRDNSAS